MSYTPSSDLGPLAVLLDDPSSSAVLTDFDGTLAPIVPDPDTAEPLPEAAQVLAELAGRFAVVGVISGRPASFLADRLSNAGDRVRLVGVYGCEWVDRDEIRRAPEVEPWVRVASEILEAARMEAPRGLGIEDKGASVTLHWRSAPEAGEWASGFANEWAERTGMLLQPGRLAVEFRPPVGLDKGTAVEKLAGGCKAACFAGDDAGDLAAFKALDRLAKSGARTVRLAVTDEESPPELAAAADMVVDGPREALAVLGQLAAAAG